MGERRRVVLRKGLDLSIPGGPRAPAPDAREPARVALLGGDHPGLHTTLQVAEGDRVRLGQTLFVDRRCPEIRFASPIAGVVRTARPEQGAQACLVIVEAAGHGERHALSFEAAGIDELLALDRGELVRRLLEAGEWPSIRERPLDCIPHPDIRPDAFFVNLMDTNPLAPPIGRIVEGREADLCAGIAALSRLCTGPTFVCSGPDVELPALDLPGVRTVIFEGPHPAGLVGTHIHHLRPLVDGRRVWHVATQQAIAIGHLLRTGKLDNRRVISVAGPLVRRPRLLRTLSGASVEELVAGELLPGECRVVAGSLLSGRAAVRPEGFLGRFHQQISVVPEVSRGSRRSWPLPFRRRGRRFPPWRRSLRWSAERHGPATAMLPLDVFDGVVPLRLPIALLLRALAAEDIEAADRFGALELVEEDLALCSFVCPAKLEYGELLRSTLTRLRPETL